MPDDDPPVRFKPGIVAYTMTQKQANEWLATTVALLELFKLGENKQDEEEATTVDIRATY